MANYTVQINMLNESGEYDVLYPEISQKIKILKGSYKGTNTAVTKDNPIIINLSEYLEKVIIFSCCWGGYNVTFEMSYYNYFDKYSAPVGTYYIQISEGSKGGIHTHRSDGFNAMFLNGNKTTNNFTILEKSSTLVYLEQIITTFEKTEQTITFYGETRNLETNEISYRSYVCNGYSDVAYYWTVCFRAFFSLYSE